MNSFELKDYRATHFLLRFLRSHLQAWYTRDTILDRVHHPAGNEKDRVIVGGLIETVTSWLNGNQPGTTPLLLADGTVLRPDLKDPIANLLFNLFRQYAAMNQRLNKVLDEATPLASRRQDFQYLVACMGWVYYEANHALRADAEFAGRFDDRELREARAGHEEASRKEVEFVDYLVNTLHLDETYNEKTGEDLKTMMESILNTEMRNQVQQVDKYLKVLGK